MTQSKATGTGLNSHRYDLSYIGLGANLPHPLHGAPRDTLEAVIEALAQQGMVVIDRSPWYESAPVPMADHPWYINGVIAVQSSLSPAELLQCLHRVEADFGRVRSIVNAPRVVDLDLLDYRGRCQSGDNLGFGGPEPVLPHPRMTERAFVLLPLRDIAPAWRDPVSGRDIDTLVAALPGDQITRPLA